MTSQIDISAIPGAAKLSISIYSDVRGSLHKLHPNTDRIFDTEEVFFTTSNYATYRGMHLQWGTHSTSKIITLISGSASWFLLDCRPGANQGAIYKERIQVPLENSYFIPIGVAQGYVALADDTKMLYQMDGDFCPNCDTGVSVPEILSFAASEVNMPLVLSERDSKLKQSYESIIH
jgi:dTDP-4-dehydrorhamnose 3,5-epimerase-like enzyme